MSTNLWIAEYVTCTTSAQHINSQLDELSKLSKRLGRPNIGHIESTLEAVTGVEPRYHPPNESNRRRLGVFFNILQILGPIRGYQEAEFRSSLSRQLDAAENDLELLNRNQSPFFTGTFPA